MLGTAVMTVVPACAVLANSCGGSDGDGPADVFLVDVSAHFDGGYETGDVFYVDVSAHFDGGGDAPRLDATGDGADASDATDAADADTG